AEGISFAQQVDIAAAQKDGKQLQADNHVDHPRTGSVTFVRLAKPVHQDAVLGQAVHDTIAADDGGIDRAGENQHADEYHEDMEHQAEQGRSGEVHGEPAEQVVDVLPARGVGDDHDGEHGDETGAEDGIDAYQVAGVNQVLHLGVGDFAINLGEGLEAAHGEQGVAEGDDHGDGAYFWPNGAVEPAEGVFAELDIGGDRQGRKLHASLEQQGDGAPDEEGGHHDGGDLHDAQRLAAGFVDALDVAPPEE